MIDPALQYHPPPRHVPEYILNRRFIAIVGIDYEIAVFDDELQRELVYTVHTWSIGRTHKEARRTWERQHPGIAPKAVQPLATPPGPYQRQHFRPVDTGNQIRLHGVRDSSARK